METQPNQEKQMSLEEALEYNRQTQEDAAQNSQFVKIGNHETVTLPFANPPVIKKKQLSGTEASGRAYVSEQFEFDLRAKTSDGKTKTWSIGVNNKIVPEIFELLKKGIFDIKIHREGEGTSTKYSISKERAL